MKQTQFKVVTVSKNTNSFGLHGVIIVSKEGQVYEVGISSWCCPKQGNLLTGSISDNNNLSSIDGISYEIPRRLKDMPQEAVEKVFGFVLPSTTVKPESINKVVKRQNIAKGKRVNTTLDFCKVFGTLSVDNKMAVIKNMESTVASNMSPGGVVLKPEEREAMKQLIRWAGVNLFVGNELCPPESLKQY